MNPGDKILGIDRIKQMRKSWERTAALAALVLLAYGVFRLVPYEARKPFLREDSPVEYLGAIAFLTTQFSCRASS